MAARTAITTAAAQGRTQTRTECLRPTRIMNTYENVDAGRPSFERLRGRASASRGAASSTTTSTGGGEPDALSPLAPVGVVHLIVRCRRVNRTWCFGFEATRMTRFDTAVPGGESATDQSSSVLRATPNKNRRIALDSSRQ